MLAPVELVVFFDLDGTLWDVPPGIDYDDPKSVAGAATPRTDAIQRVQRLVEEGARVAYLTGRSEPTRDATLRDLRRCGLPDAPLHMQDAWRGYDEMVTFKRDALRAGGATHYVGDTWADKKAARLANVRFINDKGWRAGRTLPTPAPSQEAQA